MKMTPNQLVECCRNGEEWRRKKWFPGVRIGYNKKHERIDFDYNEAYHADYPVYDVIEADRFDDWEQYKKPIDKYIKDFEFTKELLFSTVDNVFDINNIKDIIIGRIESDNNIPCIILEMIKNGEISGVDLVFLSSLGFKSFLKDYHNIILGALV